MAKAFWFLVAITSLFGMYFRVEYSAALFMIAVIWFFS